MQLVCFRPRWDNQAGDNYRHSGPYQGPRGPPQQYGGHYNNYSGNRSSGVGVQRWNAPHTEAVHWDEAKECDPSDWTKPLPRNEKLEQYVSYSLQNSSCRIVNTVTFLHVAFWQYSIVYNHKSAITVHAPPSIQMHGSSVQTILIHLSRGAYIRARVASDYCKCITFKILHGTQCSLYLNHFVSSHHRDHHIAFQTSWAWR